MKAYLILCLVVAVIIPTVKQASNHRPLPSNLRMSRLIEKLEHIRREKQVDEILLIDHLHTTQALISKVLRKYSRLRDFHHDPPLFMLSAQLCNLIAYKINSTLVSLVDLNISESEVESTDKYSIATTNIADARMAQMYTERLSRNQSRPSITIYFPIALNFAYCSEIHKSDQRFFAFLTTLVQKIGKKVWICTITSILLISSILKKSGNENYILITICVLITPGVCGRRFKCIPFLIWMLCCIVLTTYYLGDLTSEVISPTPEARISTFNELLEQNFSFLFDSVDRPNRVKSFVASSPETRNRTGIPNLGMQTLDLIRNAKVVPSKRQFIENLANSQSSAAIDNWIVATSHANRGNDFIREFELQKHRCYIGNELRFHYNFIFAFTGKDPEKLSNIFGTIVEAGFADIWSKEYIGVGVARRVQDRLRCISPTRILGDKEPAMPLTLEEKFLDLIWLWLIGLFLSALVLLSEICSNSCNLTVLLWSVTKCVCQKTCQFITKTKRSIDMFIFEIFVKYLK